MESDSGDEQQHHHHTLRGGSMAEHQYHHGLDQLGAAGGGSAHSDFTMFGRSAAALPSQPAAYEGKL